MFSWIKKIVNKIKQELAYRKRLKELNRKIHQYGKSKSEEEYPDKDSMNYDLGKKDPNLSYLLVSNEVPEFTEKTACEILEFIKNIKTAKTRGSSIERNYFTIQRHEAHGMSHLRVSFSEGFNKPLWRVYANGENDWFEGWLSGLV